MDREEDRDADLMLRVQQGDDASFELLVERYKQPVVNMVYRIVGDFSESEDLAQKVFIQAYRASERYRPTARFSTWLFTIARNLSLNELRRRRRRPSVPLDEAPESPMAGTSRPSEALLHAELGETIEGALHDLPVNQRTAIVLLLERNLSYEEIACVLGCSVSAVKALIHRARETLRRRIRSYMEEGPPEEVR